MKREKRVGIRKGLCVWNKPSQREIDDHERTHIPFRNWCKHCVFGRAKSTNHEKDKEDEKGVPKVSKDYMYMKAVKKASR